MYNNATLIRRDLLTRLCRMLHKEVVEEKIDRVPLEMRPRHGEEISRCCTHKDRAVIKYRLMAMLGFDVRDEKDELTMLSEYVRMGREEPQNSPVFLTVADEACSSCVKNNYVVSNLCRGCIGHPCTFTCKKEAISIDKQAHIDPAKCVNCGLCMQACPFNAIVYQPVPCEEACPVGAISKDEHGIEHIDEAKCIYCGRCKQACPYGAVMEKTQLVPLYDALNAKQHITLMFAPSLQGQFPATLGQMITALTQLGFSDVVEVAKGANITTNNEAHEFEERLEAGAPFMTTSCCYSYTSLVKKHLTDLAPFVSETRTPMSYTAELVKKANAETKTVFVAPCVSKRQEGFYDENVDWVISYEELGAMFIAAEIDVMKCEETAYDEKIHSSGRAFAFTGGVAESVKIVAKHPEKIRAATIDGIDKSVIRELKNVKKTCGGDNQPNFLEMMMCKGGCVNGCNVLANPKAAARQIQTFVSKDYEKKNHAK